MVHRMLHSFRITCPTGLATFVLRIPLRMMSIIASLKSSELHTFLYFHFIEKIIAFDGL